MTFPAVGSPRAGHSNERTPEEINLSQRVQLGMICLGPIIATMLLVGFVGLAGFIPAQAPTASAEQIKNFYVSNLANIRVGLAITTLSMCLVAPWAVALAMQTRRIEKAFPALCWVQLLSCAIGMSITVLSLLAWQVAAFRPDEISPEITRMLNDFGWLTFLLIWPPFTFWAFSVGVAILNDRSPNRVFPRWAAFLSFFVSLLPISESMVAIFKSGPFAFNGLLALYIPTGCFLIWMQIMTVLTIKALRAERVELNRVA